jgi:sulfide:quinone oxidoreductase
VTERVLVLGAGAGGTMVANRLDRALAGLGEVTVVDRDPTHRYQPALSLHPFGSMELDDHERDVREYLRPDVRFRRATVTDVDPDARTVGLADGELGYDRLVVALGHAIDGDRAPWRGEPDVYPFYRPDAARALRRRLSELVDEPVTATDRDATAAGPAADGLAADGGTATASPATPAATPANPLRVVVTAPADSVSCGGTSVKAALLTAAYLDDRGVPAAVTLATPGEAVFGRGRKARYESRTAELVDERGVEHVPGFEVASVAGRTVTGTDGRRLPYDIYLPVSPQCCPAALTEGSPLTAPVDGEQGAYVAVDRESLRHRTYDRVYALGDCTDLPTSKTAAAARKQAGTLAANLVADVTDQPREAGYDGFAACPLLTRRGRAMIAAYDYDGVLAPAVESRLGWWADVAVVPRLYWGVWLRGYLL